MLTAEASVQLHRQRSWLLPITTEVVGLIGLAIAIFFIVKGIRGGVLLSILVTTIITLFAGVVEVLEAVTNS